MDESLTDKIFAALNFLVLERIDAGSFRIAGSIPDWVIVCYPNLAPGDTVLIPEEQFLFLDNFLIDAEEFWLNNRQKQLKSGIWTEAYLPGNECYFEASALCINNKNILLIELLDTEVEEKFKLIQTARENSLNHHNLIKEIQKKEVLLHCILHDLAGQLTSINCCFALLELDNLTARGKEQLEIGRKQSQKQEMLIRDILEAFSTEVNALKNFTLEPALAPNALTCARDVVTGLLPTFSLCQVGLELADNIDATTDWKVVGESSRLERIISNLVENALRYTPPESSVTVNLQQDGEYILFTVDDEGTGVEPEVAQNLFKQFSQGKTNSGRAGLGLYFCRITVERWGGSIGYSPLPEGGSRFWFRLLKAVSP